MYANVLQIGFNFGSDWSRCKQLYFSVNVDVNKKILTVYFCDSKKEIKIKVQPPETPLQNKYTLALRNNYILTSSVENLKRFLENEQDAAPWNNCYIKLILEKYFNIELQRGEKNVKN